MLSLLSQAYLFSLEWKKKSEENNMALEMIRIPLRYQHLGLITYHTGSSTGRAKGWSQV